jgi:hypothetical protein
MLPMKFLRLTLGERLASDTAWLANAAAGSAALIAAPFGYNENVAFADLTLATFTGSTPLAMTTGDQQAGVDPLSGQQKVTVLAPAGGWRWECTAAPTPAQVIYGIALIDHTGAVLMALLQFPSAITIAAIGDFIDAGKLEIVFVLQPMS